MIETQRNILVIEVLIALLIIAGTVYYMRQHKETLPQPQWSQQETDPIWHIETTPTDCAGDCKG